MSVQIEVPDWIVTQALAERPDLENPISHIAEVLSDTFDKRRRRSFDPGRIITAARSNQCALCKTPIQKGEQMGWATDYDGTKNSYHVENPNGQRCLDLRNDREAKKIR
jgi:hypothetical protein